MLITFEGIDGSGKSTQIQLLERQLKDRGFSVETFREPGGTELSEKVRNLLLPDDLNVHPIAEIFLFSAARAQLVAEKVKPLLEENTAVILDRYYDSTIAYQGYGRDVMPLRDLHKINALATQNLEPDITFYLRLSHEQAEKRTSKELKDRIEQSGEDFYRNVLRGFDRLAETEERYVIVDGTMQPEKIQEVIMSKMSSKFPVIN